MEKKGKRKPLRTEGHKGYRKKMQKKTTKEVSTQMVWEKRG
jgi:hypothetical protein